ncbi:MAG: hypothetical protein LBW85_08680 [Deltaproteobacteria bacterium]|nr:hypothetical protein [Deltaproteobacteria bacterium]
MGGRSVFRFTPQDKLFRRPDGGSRDVSRKGACTRRLLAGQTCSYGRITAGASLPIAQGRKCGARKMIGPAIAFPKKSCAKGFARDAPILMRETSVLSAANFLRVSRVTAGFTLIGRLERHFARRALKNLRRFAAD